MVIVLKVAMEVDDKWESYSCKYRKSCLTPEINFSIIEYPVCIWKLLLR